MLLLLACIAPIVFACCGIVFGAAITYAVGSVIITAIDRITARGIIMRGVIIDKHKKEVCRIGYYNPSDCAFFIMTQADEVYKVTGSMNEYYSLTEGDPVSFEITVGRITNKQITSKIIAKCQKQ